MNEQQQQQGVKATGGVEGGTKPPFAVVLPPNAPAPAVTPGGAPEADAHAAGVAGTFRPRLANESNDIPLALSQIHEHLAELTGGRLKSVAGALCYPRKDEKTGRDKPEYLRDAPSLFAWIDGYAHTSTGARSAAATPRRSSCGTWRISARATPGRPTCRTARR